MRSAVSIVAACALAAIVVPTAQWRPGATALGAGEPRLSGTGARAARLRHYVFFGRDRDALRQASSFLQSASFEGAQVVYSWRQLEPEPGVYDFGAIRDDLALLHSSGKKLFVQVQDVSFTPARVNVPEYLLHDTRYGGGADRQYRIDRDDEATAVVEGWVARRWDPAVRERFHKLLFALGAEFDGRVQGVNLPETAIEMGQSGRLFPKDFSFEGYRDAVIANMQALRRAFRTSVPMQYANFMPGEWLPDDDKGYLRSVYAAAVNLKVGLGGPDLLPYRKGQQDHSYPLMAAAAGSVPTGIAVQEGNYEDRNPVSGARVEVAELLAFATEQLRVEYLFWGTQEPFYSREVIPLVSRAGE